MLLNTTEMVVVTHNNNTRIILSPEGCMVSPSPAMQQSPGRVPPSLLSGPVGVGGPELQIGDV